jgi:hypothetical protein
MPTILTPANVGNYQVSKGILQIKIPAISGTLQNLGNVNKASLDANVSLLEHYSGSSAGPKVRDFVIPGEIKVTLNMVLDEICAENFRIAVTGTESSGVIALYATSNINCEVIFTGTNAIGPQFAIDLFNVMLIPAKKIDLIGQTWNELEIDGQVLIDANGHYGTVTQIGA